METEFLAWLGKELPPHNCLRLGLGDDAAIVALAGRPECLVTVDMINDQVDFDLAKDDPRRIGRKALAVNLSDIAAMAGRPLAAVIALALPRAGALALAKELYLGMLPLADQFDFAIAGGDTNCWDGPLAISVTMLGEIAERGALKRSGARPGDWLLATGSFGGSILGRHFDFEPRVREALVVNERYELHAGMDVSDGLSLDASRLAEASGCGVALRLGAIPISSAAETLAAERNDGISPLEHALSDGEDFELLLAVGADEARRLLRDQPLGTSLTAIGEFVPEPGLWQVDLAGTRKPLPPRGWVH
ncbi:MAG TPA: thiamine-phosphate kinase [Pirellulales bacterium]|nr:thiamine-phosphate kinase [Pirellulales bacterium]